MRKKKLWRMLQKAMDGVDHDPDCAIEKTENEEETTACDCWVGPIAAALERKAARAKLKAAALLKESPDNTPISPHVAGVYRARIRKIFRELSARVPADIPWPSMEVAHVWDLRSSEHGRPVGGGYPPDPTDTERYRTVALFPKGKDMGECWVLYESFQDTLVDMPPGREQAPAALPPGLSWRDLLRMTTEYAAELHRQVTRYLVKAEDWRAKHAKLADYVARLGFDLKQEMP